MSALQQPRHKPRKESLRIATVPATGGTLVRYRVHGVNEPGFYAFRKLWQTWEAIRMRPGSPLIATGDRLPWQDRARKGPCRLGRGRPLFMNLPSEPLSEFVSRMFKYSSNFTAEMLFKMLSARPDDGVQGSWDRSAALAATWWKVRGLPGQPVVKNGSGMGDIDRISPARRLRYSPIYGTKKPFCPTTLPPFRPPGLTEPCDPDSHNRNSAAW